MPPDIRRLYANEKDQIVRQLKDLQPDQVKLFDNQLFTPQYTIVIRPEAAVVEKIADFSRQLQQKFPEHYYYSPDLYHLTLLGGMDIDQVSESRLIEVMNQVLPDHPFQIWLEGDGANTQSVAIAGYADPPVVTELRQKLRHLLGAGDDYTIHNPAWEKMVWVNFIRYQKKPSPDFFTYLGQFADEPFGQMKKLTIELHANQSKILANSRLVHRLTI